MANIIKLHGDITTGLKAEAHFVHCMLGHLSDAPKTSPECVCIFQDALNGEEMARNLCAFFGITFE